MTAKELAKLLGVSETAVSFALNNKPGVSTETRNRIKKAAQQYNVERPYTVPALQQPEKTFAFIFYRKSNAIFNNSFFDPLLQGAENMIAGLGAHMNLSNVYSTDHLIETLKSFGDSGISGAIILGTEMKHEDFMPLAFSEVPLVLLDNHFMSSKIDSVEINNREGVHLAIQHLVQRTGAQPGHLKANFNIRNFEEREAGYQQALRHYGFSLSNSISHTLAVSAEGAYADMLQILKRGDKLARCYFADNDEIAIGAMRAFRECGYRIPGDVAIVGFDDVDVCPYVDPPLTTIHVPNHYMGHMAAQRLVSLTDRKPHYSLNVQIGTHLVTRKSV